MKDYQPGSPQHLAEELASMQVGLRTIDRCRAFNSETRIERRRRVYEKASSLGIYPMLAAVDEPLCEAVNVMGYDVVTGRRTDVPVRGGVED